MHMYAWAEQDFIPFHTKQILGLTQGWKEAALLDWLKYPPGAR